MTTEAMVRAILDVSVEITDLSPFILAAEAAVSQHCTDISLDDAETVETWLAAHFVCIRDTRPSQEAAGSVSQSFQYKLDLGLACSMYGQTAMFLDPTGGLAAWNAAIVKGKTTAPRIVWLGTPPDTVVSV